MWLSPIQGRQDLGMLAGFFASYLLRGATSSFEKFCRTHCYVCICGRDSDASAVLAGERGLSWRVARTRLSGVHDGPLIAVAALRLVLWHLMQPVCFFLILYSWSDKITSQLQQLLAVAVLLREILYLTCTLVALITSPAFLLIDIAGTWRTGAFGEVIVYVLMPEKFLGWYISGAEPAFRRRFNAYFTLVLMLDVCGLLALYLGAAGVAELPVPLAACYCVTTVSLLALPCWAFGLLLLRHLGALAAFPVPVDIGTSASVRLDMPTERSAE